MKKWLALILTLAMSCAFITACNKDSNGGLWETSEKNSSSGGAQTQKPTEPDEGWTPFY